jgi:D-threo-aldose 1-dehydrogenase
MPVFDFSRAGAEASLESSRERLGLDGIDIVFIHDPDDHHRQALEETYPALVEARRNGRLRAIGVGMNYAEPLAQFAGEAEFDCMLCAGRYTLLEQPALDNLLPAAAERGVSIVAGGVYNSGILADPKPGAPYNYAPADGALVARAQELAAVCRDFGVPLRAAALQFPLAHPAIACVAVGARSPDEVEDNVRMLQTEIPADLWDALRERGLIRADAPTP